MKWMHRLLLVALAFSAHATLQARELGTDERALHVLNRLGYGPRPGDVERVTAFGVERYIDAQLHSEAIAVPPALTQRLDGLAAIHQSTGAALAQFEEARKAAKNDDEDGKKLRRETYQRMGLETAEARLARAIDSPRQLEEVMVDFWFNHFNVFAGKGLDRAFIASYERDAIRPHALGNFRELLGATAKHPAMLFYLDNWLSVAPGYQPPQRRGKGPANQANGLNENFAREVMELHTLGVDGGYTQQDVTALARMLTGWTFLPRELIRNDTGFQFDARRHDDGDKQWLGRQVSGRGRDEGEMALDVLAAHPATARHISYQLAQYFVADVPPPALVDRLAKRFQSSQGDIRAVLATLFASAEFWDPATVGGKFKTPYQYVVSAARAANLPVVNVRPLIGTLAQLGMPLYGCATPDGYKNTEAAWLNPDALTRRINFATALASGKLPLARPDDDAAAPAMGKAQLERATDGERAANARWASDPVDPTQLANTLGGTISAQTRTAVADSQPALRAALLLGSPDFMRH